MSDGKRRELTPWLMKENDGRWLARVDALPGLIAYGHTEQQARGRAQAFSRRVLELDAYSTLDGKKRGF